MSLSVRRLVGVLTVLLVVSGMSWCASAFAKTGYIPLTSFAPPGGFNGPFGLAVDNSASLSKGDVYVTDQGNDFVDEFSAAGALLAQASVPGVTLRQMTVDDHPGLLEGDVYVAGSSDGVIYRFAPGLVSREELITGLEDPTDVAVDEAGDVFVLESTAGKVLEFNSVGAPINESGVVVGAGENTVVEGLEGPNAALGYEGPSALAVDAGGTALYVNTNHMTVKYTLSGGVYVADSEPFDREGYSSGVAISPSGDVYIDQDNHGPDGVEGREVTEYEPSGVLLTTAASGTLSYSAVGLGVNGESGDLYVADQGNNVVYIFEAGEMPAIPTTEPYSQLNGGMVTLNGTLPGGETSYYFAYNAGSNCEGGQTTTPVTASGAQQVHAELSELSRFTHYSFCLIATNKYGSEVGSVLSFETGQPSPRVKEESAASVFLDSAIVTAQVDPEGVASTYYVEYGPNVPYESKTAEVSVGSDESPVTVSSTLTGLTPGTSYHFRFVARNEAGSTQGTDLTFTTYPAGVSGLPDGRVYEMVSPVENDNAEAYGPAGSSTPNIFSTFRPFQASANGNAIVYESDPTVGGNGQTGLNFGNAELATRNPGGGWTQTTIQPDGHKNSIFEAFSPDLSTSIVEDCDQPVLGARAPTVSGQQGYVEIGYNVLYTHNDSDGSYQSLFTTTPSNRDPEKEGENQAIIDGEDPEKEGENQAIIDGEYAILFGTAGVEMRAGNDNVGSGLEGCDRGLVYAGASQDFSRLLFEADDALLEGDGGLEKELDSDVKHEVEANEVHNYLYESVGGRLSLVNVLPEGTVAPNATFGAQGSTGPDFSRVISADGSRIFWTDLSTGVVYVRENGSSTVAVSAGPAQYWTASSDGRYAFYTEDEKLYRFDVEGGAREELAGGGAGVQGVIEASENGERLYFVADGSLVSGASAGQPNLYVWHAGVTSFIATLSQSDAANDWTGVMGHRVAESTPDGKGFVFTSTRSLTRYPNEGQREIYVYESEPAELFCASCNQDEQSGSSGTLQESFDNTNTAQSISEDGGRVFFDSSSSLTPQATSGRQQVYEWERDDEGTCQHSGGCVFLLSGGIGEAVLIGASATGDDAFFVTTASLVPGGEEYPNVYDARVAGAPLAQSACSGTGCQGAPSAPLPFATPASVTFAGLGNFPSPSVAPVVKARVKSLARAQKLLKALKACKTKRGRKRALCEAQAHKHYGVKSTKSRKPAKGRGK